MKSFFLLALALTLGLSSSWAEQSGSLGLSSIVSTTEPGLRVPSGASISWRESAMKVQLDDRYESAAISSVYRSAIEMAVSEKGYRLAEADTPADFELGFLLALSSSLDDDQILRQFGFTPGLQSSEDNESSEKGTLVIILINPRNGRSMWRGALQAFVKPGASESDRRQRAQSAAAKLTRLMPDVP